MHKSGLLPYPRLGDSLQLKSRRRPENTQIPRDGAEKDLKQLPGPKEFFVGLPNLTSQLIRCYMRPFMIG